MVGQVQGGNQFALSFSVKGAAGSGGDCGELQHTHSSGEAATTQLQLGPDPGRNFNFHVGQPNFSMLANNS